MQVPTAPLPAMPGAIGLGGTPASARLLQEPGTPATEAGPLKPLCRTGSTAHSALLHDPLRHRFQCPCMQWCFMELPRQLQATSNLCCL